MGFMDKLLGRGKKAAGDVTGDASLQTRRNASGTRRHGRGSRGRRGGHAQEAREEAAEHHAERES